MNKISQKRVAHEGDEVCCEAGRPRVAGLLPGWMFAGASLLAASSAARLAYPANPGAADAAGVLGSVITMAPVMLMALRELGGERLRMSLLVAVAVGAAFVAGEYLTAGWVAFLMLLSTIVESRAAERAFSAVEALVKLAPARALLVLPDGGEREVLTAELKKGDRIRIGPGDTAPADGVIIQGRTSLNEATITGESAPADKGPGDEIFAGTENLTGGIVAEITKVGPDTTLGRVQKLILAAEKTKLPVMRIADRYAGYYTPAVLMAAAIVWTVTRDMNRVIAFLLISCPCAIILAAPSALVAALSAAARAGILVKNAADLETAARVDAVVFDKTGTLTSGKIRVARLAPRGGVPPSELLRLAGSAEKFSHHPAAAAMAQLAQEAGVALSEPAEFEESPGQGARAVVDGKQVLVGRPEWLVQNGAQIQADDSSEVLSLADVACNGRHIGRIFFEDRPRQGARESLAELAGLKVGLLAMITGDRENVARRVAEQLGCNEVRARALPDEKVEYVRGLKEKGWIVAVVGDGINDAPALATGHIGIAMGAAGSEAAVRSASIALMNNDLMRIPFVIRLSRAMRGLIFQNMIFAMGLMAAGLVLSGAGRLSPVAAAVLHNIGSLLVVFNSARLFRFGEKNHEQSRP